MSMIEKDGEDAPTKPFDKDFWVNQTKNTGEMHFIYVIFANNNLLTLLYARSLPTDLKRDSVYNC